MEVVQRYLHVREEELAPELAKVEKPRVCHASAKYTRLGARWTFQEVSRGRPALFGINNHARIMRVGYRE